MPTGTIKKFNDERGFGFIVPHGGGNDVFVHASAFKDANLGRPAVGQQLEYELDSRGGKTRAINLKNFKGSAEDAERASGTVKWFNRTKGFGFIVPHGGGNDVFVHLSAVEKAGWSNLFEGQSVSFIISKDRGRNAATSLQAA